MEVARIAFRAVRKVFHAESDLDFLFIAHQSVFSKRLATNHASHEILLVKRDIHFSLKPVSYAMVYGVSAIYFT